MTVTASWTENRIGQVVLRVSRAGQLPLLFLRHDNSYNCDWSCIPWLVFFSSFLPFGDIIKRELGQQQLETGTGGVDWRNSGVKLTLHVKIHPFLYHPARPLSAQVITHATLMDSHAQPMDDPVSSVEHPLFTWYTLDAPRYYSYTLWSIVQSPWPAILTLYSTVQSSNCNRKKKTIIYHGPICTCL